MVVRTRSRASCSGAEHEVRAGRRSTAAGAPGSVRAGIPGAGAPVCRCAAGAGRPPRGLLGLSAEGPRAAPNRPPPECRASAPSRRGTVPGKSAGAGRRRRPGRVPDGPGAGAAGSRAAAARSPRLGREPVPGPRTVPVALRRVTGPAQRRPVVTRFAGVPRHRPCRGGAVVGSGHRLAPGAHPADGAAGAHGAEHPVDGAGGGRTAGDRRGGRAGSGGHR